MLLAVLASLLLAPGTSPIDARSPLQQPWTWHDETGREVHLRDWSGHPLVLTMFYRSCETRCPHTLQRLKVLGQFFAARGQVVHFALVSLDPHNDKPAQLMAFKRALGLPGDRWHLLVGDDADTRGLGELLGVHPIHDGDHIDHATRIAIYDSQGRLAHQFNDWQFEDRAASDVR